MTQFVSMVTMNAVFPMRYALRLKKQYINICHGYRVFSVRYALNKKNSGVSRIQHTVFSGRWETRLKKQNGQSGDTVHPLCRLVRH